MAGALIGKCRIDPDFEWRHGGRCSRRWIPDGTAREIGMRFYINSNSVSAKKMGWTDI